MREDRDGGGADERLLVRLALDHARPGGAGRADRAGAARQDALLLAARALLRYRQGRHAEAARTAEEAVAVARRSGARDVLARAFYLLDVVDVARGRYGGEPWAEQALVIWEELGDLSWQAQALNALGARAYFEGRWDDALGYYRKAGEAFGRAGNQWNAAITACNVGEILSNQGRYAEAEDAVHPAERVLRASGTPAETAFAASFSARRPRGAVVSKRPSGCWRRRGRTTSRWACQTEAVAAEISIAEALLYAGEAGEALARADGVMTNSPVSAQRASASALARVRGYALALLGRAVRSQGSIDESLRTARRAR